MGLITDQSPPPQSARIARLPHLQPDFLHRGTLQLGRVHGIPKRMHTFGPQPAPGHVAHVKGAASDHGRGRHHQRHELGAAYLRGEIFTPCFAATENLGARKHPRSPWAQCPLSPHLHATKTPSRTQSPCTTHPLFCYTSPLSSKTFVKLKILDSCQNPVRLPAIWQKGAGPTM